MCILLWIRIGFNADSDPDPAFYLRADKNPDPGAKQIRINEDPDPYLESGQMPSLKVEF